MDAGELATGVARHSRKKLWHPTMEHHSDAQRILGRGRLERVPPCCASLHRLPALAHRCWEGACWCASALRRGVPWVHSPSLILCDCAETTLPPLRCRQHDPVLRPAAGLRQRAKDSPCACAQTRLHSDACSNQTQVNHRATVASLPATLGSLQETGVGLTCSRVLWSLCSVLATVRDLRAALALQSAIPVECQSLTRERRHWFDAAAAPGTAPAHDDFTDDTLSMQAAGIAHGDMLYVIAKPTRAQSSVDSDASNGAVTPAADDDEEESAAAAAASASPPALERHTSLVFRGWLADEVESAAAVAAAQSAALASQAAATELLHSIRETIRRTAHGADPGLDPQLEELSRLILLCGPRAAWESSAAAGAVAASAQPALSAEASPTDSIAPARSVTRARPSSSSRNSSRGAPSSQELDDGGSHSLGHSRPSSASRLVSATAVAASADPVAELTNEVAYWRGRYDRLRVKAEKMNAAGLSLQNSLDVASLQHEKAMLLMKGRLAKRDAKLAVADRTIRAWQMRDRLEWGGDGSIELAPEDRAELTSLASAPSLRSAARSQPQLQQQPSQPHPPAPPRSVVEAPSSAAAIDVAPRRPRPESAGRYRSSRPSSGDSAGHATAAIPSSAVPATSASLHSSPPPGASSSPLIRPSSAGRSRRATGPSALTAAAVAAAAAAAPSSSPLSSDSWNSAASTLALPSHQLESVALHAAHAQQQLLTSRSQVRQAVDSAKQARAGLAGSRVNALVAGPYAKEL